MYSKRNGKLDKEKKRNEKNYEMNLEKCVTQRCFNNFNIRNFWNFPFLYFSFRSCYLYFKFFYINNIVRYIMYFNTQQFFFISSYGLHPCQAPF